MFESVRVGGSARPRVLIVGRYKDEPIDRATRSLSPAIAQAGTRPEGAGDVGSIAEAFPSASDGPERILLVGLGPRSDFTPGTLRQVGAAAAQRLAQIEARTAGVELIGPLRKARVDPQRAGCCMGEGVGLRNWTCETFRGSSTTTTRLPRLSLRSDDAAFTRGMRRGLALAESANLARTLSQTPPNVATPAWMASQARSLARKVALRCTVLKGPRLVEERLEGLVNVGKASVNKPCLIRLEYRPPRGRKSDRPVVLLGKTVCYDTGGLSLKINNSMKGMKRDKDGGCAVLGAMHAIATVVKPSRPVVGLLVAAENSISDQAYRPDDVLTFRNGVTVEVTNTDAEGRLVLADGLCWACQKEKPAAIINLATLTGGIVVALGGVYAGLWCDDDPLRDRLDRASQASGERLWRLPHHQDYRDMMKSPIADILNSAPVRAAHPIQGAAFLSYFVDEAIPWAHIDIAGVHAVEKDTGPFIAGPTAFGTRLLAELLSQD